MELEKLKISKNRIDTLHNMNINCVEDLITYYPYKYETIRETYPNSNDDKIVIEGKVISPCKVFYKGKFSRLSFKMIDQYDHEYNITIFNRHFLRTKLLLGTVITVIGKYNNFNITASDIKLSSLKELSGIHPVYSIKEGINNKSLIKYIDKALNLIEIKETLPEELIIKNKLISRKEAILNIHHPKSDEDVLNALYYLKYEEFFYFSLTNQYIKSFYTQSVGISKHINNNELISFVHSLPFELTDDQKRVINEIVRDLKSDKTMYRFIQGDVGSGKTVVSSIGLYANYIAGYQGALMAPTEILALQHYNTLKDFFKDTPVRLALLTGSTSIKDKTTIYEQLKNNEIDIVIGTHALFQDKVEYNCLGLVITDEQHRFGVKQRKALKNKGQSVDFLIMSATPIPRTLAIALYGDMDVSTIHTKPSNRKEVITKYVNTSSMKPILNDLNHYLSTGGQVYVVCPLVEENDSMNLRSATQIATAMSQYFEPHYHVGLLHGKMNDDDKNEIMGAFILNRIQILVSTTVIEVGVDVKNANMIVIYNADRFGLSQIHQLRGRVGRSDVQSYCYLLSDSDDDKAVERLKFIESNSDGFEISRYDLLMRGPGDLLGYKQSGVPIFTIGNPLKDTALLEASRDDASYILNEYLSYNNYHDLISQILLKIEHNNDYID